MKNHITVYYEGSGLFVTNEVARLKGLTSGQRIQTEDHYWDILGANAEHNIKRLELTKPVWSKSKDKSN